MNTATREETKFIQKIILFVIIPLIAFSFMKVKISGQCDSLKEKIVEMEQRISRYMKKKGAMPTLKRVMETKDLSKRYGDSYDLLLSFSAVGPITTPDDVIEKGVYFKKQLYMAFKDLKSKAQEKGVLIPESLGFGEALPSEKDVPLLLRKLETVNKLMGIMIRYSAGKVSIVKLLNDRNLFKETKGEIPFIELEVRIDAECSLVSFSQIMHAVGQLKPFVGIKDIDVKLLKDELYEVSFVFSRLIIEK